MQTVQTLQSTKNDLISQLQQQPIIFVGGKGGVGKTTTAAAIAVSLAKLGRKTLIISTDPAHSLGDALKIKLTAQIHHISDHLSAVELDPAYIVDKHFQQVEKTIRGYANPDMLPKIAEFLRLSKSAPGAQEAAMLEAMCHYLVQETQNFDHVIFDTAPTGHTLRLLMLPEMMGAWTDGLLAQQRRQTKLKSVARHLGDTNSDKHSHKDGQLNNPFAQAPNDRWTQAVEVLEKRKQLFRQAGQKLHNPKQTAIVLVMIPEMLSLQETQRACQQLKEADMPCSAIVVNQVIQQQQSDDFWQQRADRQAQILAQIEKNFATYPRYYVSLKAEDIRGVGELQDFLNG
ncbi:ArsA family ATPase [Psychrobacter sp. I-STPA10]|uniref:ArsA family ATPase n=1 Tax=Psychrobacter sp. I-STPA10 TaxID=2585769 RepID=UPI001E4954CE|nr:ArsA family ATPase [Psychrobacter sp. I-STPA10]